MKLSAPWEICHKEIEALFGEDPEIDVVYSEEDKEIKLLVSNAVKADALYKILPPEKVFGNVTVKITVVQANGEESMISMYQKAFDGNPAFVDAVETTGSFKTTYIVFAKEVVQYFTDNLKDLNGNCSTLYQDIAERVIEDHEGVFFCTSDNELGILWDVPVE